MRLTLKTDWHLPPSSHQDEQLCQLSRVHPNWHNLLQHLGYSHHHHHRHLNMMMVIDNDDDHHKFLWSVAGVDSPFVRRGSRPQLEEVMLMIHRENFRLPQKPIWRCFGQKIKPSGRFGSLRMIFKFWVPIKT